VAYPGSGKLEEVMKADRQRLVVTTQLDFAKRMLERKKT
jgi:hypothetical protein